MITIKWYFSNLNKNIYLLLQNHFKSTVCSLQLFFKNIHFGRFIILGTVRDTSRDVVLLISYYSKVQCWLTVFEHSIIQIKADTLRVCWSLL